MAKTLKNSSGTTFVWIFWTRTTYYVSYFKKVLQRRHVCLTLPISKRAPRSVNIFSQHKLNSSNLFHLARINQNGRSSLYLHKIPCRRSVFILPLPLITADHNFSNFQIWDIFSSQKQSPRKVFNFLTSEVRPTCFKSDIWFDKRLNSQNILGMILVYNSGQFPFSLNSDAVFERQLLFIPSFQRFE